MRIGIDLDDTICSTKEEIEKYSKLFCNIKNISENELWNSYKEEFLNTYLEKIYINAKLKKGVKNAINELSKKNIIYIITARTTKYINDILRVIEDYLNQNEIIVNYIIINAGDKVEECIKNHIDIMIDDSSYNCQKLKENNIRTLLFAETNINSDNINSFNDWNNSKRIIDNEMISNQKQI